MRIWSEREAGEAERGGSRRERRKESEEGIRRRIGQDRLGGESGK